MALERALARENATLAESMKLVCAVKNLVCAAVALVICGCASPGVPKPPSLRLPNAVEDLRAERVGAAVVLRFKTPLRTTDGGLVEAGAKAEVCRAVGDAPCVSVGRRSVAGEVVWNDVLGGDLAAGPARLLTYTVRVFNTRGHVGAVSNEAFAAAGAAPIEVEGLRAEGSRRGIVLHWLQKGSDSVLVERTAVSDATAQSSGNASAPKPAKKQISLPGAAAANDAAARQAKVVLASDGVQARDPGGMIDRSAVAETAYVYAAYRTHTVKLSGHELVMKSDLSARVSVTLHDVFAPAAPTGVVAAAFPSEDGAAGAVDLIWEPNAEPDLVGYEVFRATQREDGSYGASERLAAAVLIPSPAFHDARLARGLHVRYTVVAVDTHGNVSAPSAAVDVAIP